MIQDDIEKRLDELLAKGNQSSMIGIQEMFHGALNIMTILYGPTSIQLQNFIKEEETIRQKYIGSAASEYRSYLVMGVLNNMKAELKAGIVGSLQKSITGEVLSDFLQLARNVFDEKGDDAKNVASVLAAALFEDTIRRLATINGIPHIDKLQDVIIELKNRDLLRGSQVGIATSYLSFRNNSLHAQWDKIERESVASVLGFCEQLLIREIT
jgi:hypothetical protein